MEKRQYTTGLPSISVYPQTSMTPGMMGGVPQTGYPGMTGGYPGMPGGYPGMMGGYPHPGYSWGYHHPHHHYHPGYQQMQMGQPPMTTGTSPKMGGYQGMGGYPGMSGYPQTSVYRSEKS